MASLTQPRHQAASAEAVWYAPADVCVRGGHDDVATYRVDIICGEVRRIIAARKTYRRPLRVATMPPAPNESSATA